MTAFVSFVQAYAVWLYLLCVLGILVGVKMLTDARRLSRTTLFSLEQERATEQSFRGVILIIVLLFVIMVVTAVAVIGPMLVPPQEPVVLGGPTATLPALIFPTNTPSPTPTFTPLPPTPTVFVTSVPITPTAARPIKPTAAPATPTPPLPAPVLVGPLPNGGTWIGEGQANAALTFRWTCNQCTLGPNDWYEVDITYTDKSGAPQIIAGRTHDMFLSLHQILQGGPFEIYQKAKEDTFSWYVRVMHGDQQLSPQSETWKFVWK